MKNFDQRDHEFCSQWRLGRPAVAAPIGCGAARKVAAQWVVGAFVLAIMLAGMLPVTVMAQVRQGNAQIRDHRGQASQAAGQGVSTQDRGSAIQRQDNRFPTFQASQLSVPQAYLQQLRQKYQVEPQVVAVDQTIRGRTNRSLITPVNEHPEGFGASVVWDRSTEEALLIMFINSADDLGVAIHGLQRGDAIEVLSIAGICSFSRGNAKLIASLVAIADAGLKVAAGVYAPEMIPLIDAGTEFAKEHLKGSDKGKRRDGYGQKAGSDKYRRQEGGILITFPEAGGPYYSGKSSSRWIKPRVLRVVNGVPILDHTSGRTDDVRPDHVRYGFFPIRFLSPQENRRHNFRTLTSSGTVYIVPWDYKFEDNTGHYKVVLRLIRRNDNTDVIIN